jgi:DNA-binding response OmpR family regulator
MKNKIIKILLLEDDPTASRQVELLLRQHKYETTIANSHKAAILLGAEFLPNLIICNARLRNGGSHQFLIEMRSNRRMKHIPFIFINGRPELKHH